MSPDLHADDCFDAMFDAPLEADVDVDLDELTGRALSGREGYIALTRTEEADLARRAQAGDRDAAWALAMANLNFVRSIAQRYLRPEIELEDLVGEGLVGLIEAAERFDPSRNVKFITYGAWWIKRALLRFLREVEHPVHVPKYKQHELQEFRRTRQRLQQELGRVPSLHEIGEATGHDPRAVQEHAGLSVAASSVDDDDIAWGLQAADDLEQAVIMRDALLRLDDVLPVLSDRERRVLTERFGLDGAEPVTLAEVGERVGLTKERVRQIEKQACARLAEAMSDIALAPRRSPAARRSARRTRPAA